MRELKFRVYDKTGGYYIAILDNDCFGIKQVARIIQELGVLKHEYIIEQDTGLKDRNGEKICEGDIVRIDSMDEIRVGYVELVADQYCIVCGENEEGNKIVAEFYYYSKPEENCKVIGNIHENPELLEHKG